MKRSRRSIKSEQDFSTPPVPSGTSPDGIIRVTRDPPPSHYLFKINYFSLLAEANFIEIYETGVFEAGSYKWRLLLYPNGNKKSNGEGYISLYLQIAATEKLPLGWQINVNFKLFVFDQLRDKYLTIKDSGAVKRFHQMKTEWGFDQLLLLESFKDASNGYLVNDSCTFGAEVFVIEQKATWENLSMIKVPAPNPISFKIENFSKLDQAYYESPLQSIVGFNWKIGVSPSGQGPFKDKQLSLFLCLAEAPGVPPKKSFYVKYKLRLMDQISSYHKERTGQGWFKTDKSVPYRIGDKVGWTWGFRDFESLENLRNASKGFLVKDTLIVEADIVLVAKPIFCS